MDPFLFWIVFVGFIGVVVFLYGFRERHRQPKQSPAENVNFIRGPGDFQFDVVGESHYQNALKEICGPRKEDGENKKVLARLIFEDSNPHDNLAVRVDIEGKTVGYLHRSSARSFRQKVKETNIPDNGLDLACYAVIRGGWDRGGGDRGHYGVWLDIPIEK